MAEPATNSPSERDGANGILRRRVLRFAPIALLGAVLVAAFSLGWTNLLSLDGIAQGREALQAFVAAHPLTAPVCFILVYALSVGCALPVAPVLTVVGGFLFGWFAGAAYALVAVTLGATTLFLAARLAFGGLLHFRTGSRAAFLSEGFRKNAFGCLIALRLAPFVPAFLVNITAGLCLVRPATFVAATLIGILPGRLAYAWLGAGVDGALVDARLAGRTIAASDLMRLEFTVALVLLSLVAALAPIVRKYWAVRAH